MTMTDTDSRDLHEVKILLVEDNEIDVMAFQRGMKKHRIANPLVIAGHGKEALDIMRGTHPDKEISNPYLIFLDLNMPIMSGLEFLKAVREDDNLNHVVIFVLTTSDHDSDLVAAYRSNVAGYILKQNVGDACANLHELLNSYWRLVVLP